MKKIFITTGFSLLITSITFGQTFNVSTAVEFQNALDTAITNGEDDTIFLSEGTFFAKDLGKGRGFTYWDQFGNVNADDKSLTIIGKGKGKTIISGKNASGSSALYIEAQNKPNFHVVIKDLTIKEGDTTFINLGKVQSSSGGGLFIVTDGSITVENVEFHHNTAGVHGDGGGAYLKSKNGTIKVNKCLFYKNTGNIGGGLSIVAGELFSSTVYNASVVITNNIFYQNAANTGGGLKVYSYSTGDINIINNTFVENTYLPSTPQAFFGGGIDIITSNQSKNINIYNNIFWKNETKKGLAKDIHVYNNEGSPIFNIFNNLTEIDQSATYIGFEAQNGSLQGNNNFKQDPLFKNVANLDFSLQPSSPCIDKGNNNIPVNLTDDYYGNNRVVDGDKDGTAAIDIGALEYTENPSNYGNSGSSNTGNSSVNTNNGNNTASSGGCNFSNNNSLLTVVVIGVFMFFKSLRRRKEWESLLN